MRLEWRLRPWSDTLNNVFLITMETETIQAGRGMFGPFLLLPLDIETPNRENHYEDIFMISGVIAGKDELHHSGLLIPTQIVGPNRHMLSVPLTDQQIEAMEYARNGGPIELLVRLSAAGTVWEQVHSFDGRESVKRRTTTAVHDEHGTNRVKIGREQWIRILEQLKQGKRKLIEIPIPELPKKRTEWEEAAACFERAIEAERKGDFDFATQECRKVVEGITKVLISNWQLSSRGNMSSQLDSIRDHLIRKWGEPEGEKIRALTGVIKAAWEFSSLPHHYGRGFIATRQQAAFMIQLTTSLFMYAGALLEERGGEGE